MQRIRQAEVNKSWLGLGWAGTAALLLTLSIFGVIRTMETYSGMTPENIFQARYIENPMTTAIHMITGLLFVVLAPLQFIQSFRNKHRTLHKNLGRVLMVSALIAGLYGLVAVATFPAYGGLATAASGWFFGPLFLFAVLRSFWHIRNKNIEKHREWIIRAFALGIGVGTQRILIGVFVTTTDYPIVEIFGPAMWIGFCFNLLVAELWINRTRGTRLAR